MSPRGLTKMSEDGSLGSGKGRNRSDSASIYWHDVSTDHAMGAVGCVER